MILAIVECTVKVMFIQIAVMIRHVATIESHSSCRFVLYRTQSSSLMFRQKFANGENEVFGFFELGEMAALCEPDPFHRALDTLEEWLHH